jgi:hypothetical protein
MSSGVPVLGERSIHSESYSRMVLSEDTQRSPTLEHHDDVTVDESRRIVLTSEVQNFFRTNPGMLQNIFDNVHFRTYSSGYIDSTFVGKKCYDDKLEGLQREISSLHAKLDELAGLTNVLPDSQELIAAMPSRDSYKTKLSLLDHNTTQLLKLVQENEFREALKLWDELALACGKLGEDTKKNIKDKADELKELSTRAVSAIDAQLQSRAELDPAVQKTIKRVQRDTLTILKQLHDTLKNRGSDQAGPSITGTFSDVERLLSTCATKVSKAFTGSVGAPQALVALTDQEMTNYGANAKLTGALVFDEGRYARWYKKYYIKAIDSGNRFSHQAKAIDALQLSVLTSIDAMSRGKEVEQATLDMHARVLHTLNLKIDSERELLKKEETNHVVKYVLDYAMGLESVLETVQDNLRLLADLKSANSEAMQKVQKAVFAFLQPESNDAQNAASVELLFEAATLRDAAKATIDVKAMDFVSEMRRAKIASLHEILAAKKDAVLELSDAEKAVSFRLSGYETIVGTGNKLEEAVRTSIEKRIVKFLYWPENPNADKDVQEHRRQEKFDLQFGIELDLSFLNTKKYASLLKQANVDHPLFKNMIDAFYAKVKDTKMETELLKKIADVEHLLYRASFPARLLHVAYARAWNHFAELPLKNNPDVKRVMLDHLKKCASDYGYIPVSKEYEEKTLQVLAENAKSYMTSVSTKLEAKQAILFRALACAIDRGENQKEAAAAQKIISTFIESGSISEYIAGHETAFNTLIFENTKIKILKHCESDIGRKEMDLFLEDPVRKYLAAFASYHSDKKFKDVMQDIQAKNIKNVKQPELDVLARAIGQFEPVFTDPFMDRVLFRLAFLNDEFAQDITSLRFMGNEDEYAEWYELMLCDMKSDKI